MITDSALEVLRLGRACLPCGTCLIEPGLSLRNLFGVDGADCGVVESDIPGKSAGSVNESRGYGGQTTADDFRGQRTVPSGADSPPDDAVPRQKYRVRYILFLFIFYVPCTPGYHLMIASNCFFRFFFCSFVFFGVRVRGGFVLVCFFLE